MADQVGDVGVIFDDKNPRHGRVIDNWYDRYGTVPGPRNLSSPSILNFFWPWYLMARSGRGADEPRQRPWTCRAVWPSAERAVQRKLTSKAGSWDLSYRRSVVPVVPDDLAQRPAASGGEHGERDGRQQQAIGREHRRRSEAIRERAGQAADRPAAAKRHHVDAHDAAAQRVGDGQLHQRKADREERHEEHAADEEQREAQPVDVATTRRAR